MTATVTNYNVRAKIEVDDITSTYVAIVVDSFGSLQVGETVIGQSSNASGKIHSLVTDVKNYVLLTERSGFFIYNEVLDGSVSGVGAANITEGQTFYTTTYNNATLDISNGLWEIYTDGDLALKINDSVRKINISKGGNYASGYTFGFSLLNFDLASQLIEDGVFLERAPCRYYIDFNDGNGFVQVWTGVINTYPRVGATSADFTCVDNMKNASQKIGSDKVPICLNKNENCKLISIGDGNAIINKYISDNDPNTIYYKYDRAINQINKRFIVDSDESLGGRIEDVDDELNTILLYIETTSDWYNALESDDGLSILISFGNQANTVFNVLKVENQGAYTSDVGSKSFFMLYLDQSTTGLTPTQTSISSPDRPANLIRLISYSVEYNLNGRDVKRVNGFTDKTQKGLTVYDNDVETYLSRPYNYNNDLQKVYVTGLSQDKTLDAKNEIELDTINASSSADLNDFGLLEKSLIIDTTIPISDLYKLNEDENQLNFIFENVSVGTDLSGTDIELSTSAVSNITIKSTGVAGKLYYVDQSQNFFDETYVLADNNVDFNSGLITITPPIPHKALEFNGFASNDVYTNIFIKIKCVLFISGNSLTGNSITREVQYEGANYVEYKTTSLETPSIGCVGENMVGDPQDYEGYPDTLKYIETEYNGIDISEIDSSSYTQAQDDYENFPAVVEHNPAHQIVEQTQFNDLLGEILFNSHLALYPSRLGKRTLNNWLWKSAVFSNTQPTDQFTNFKKITDIKRSQIGSIVSDFELEYNYSEAQDKYLSKMRIKNTDQDFNFTIDGTGSTEGITENFKAEGNEAFNLASVGEKRLKRQSKTSYQSKWIKSEAEAIAFIINQLGHLNRSHERITITLPLKFDYVLKELLDFDLVNGGKITDDENRLGWVEEIRISWKNKEISFTYFLDISEKDPFLYEVGIIQDTPSDLVDSYQVDPDELNDIIQDTGY